MRPGDRRFLAQPFLELVARYETFLAIVVRYGSISAIEVAHPGCQKPPLGVRGIQRVTVDVTTLTQTTEVGGIDLLLCQAKILGGALSEPLDNMLKDMEKTQN
ncbi:hypothetical protein OQA88_1854 [Cercophora sp. LCS_1]